MNASLIAVPPMFYADHAARALPTPVAVSRNVGRVYIRADDPAIPDLLSDAEYYAAANMDECPRALRDSARRTVAALAGRRYADAIRRR